MPLKIVTGGTTGAADGTLVSSGSPFVFAAVDTVLDMHLRCDDDTYSADQTISLPSAGDVEISFDGGSTWKDYADSPTPVVTGIGGAGLDVGDLNFPIKLRQHATTASTSGVITSDGTFTACTALADVTGFTVAPGDTQNALSWSAVTNRTYYRIDRATDSGFTTGVALDISPNHTSTSYTDTGRTNGTTYYYRIKAVGTYRFKDSASYATGNGMPDPWTLVAADDFTGSDNTLLSAHTPSGTGAAGTWTAIYNAAGQELAIYSNKLRAYYASPPAGTTSRYEHSAAQANGAVQCDATIVTTAGYVELGGRRVDSNNWYQAILDNGGNVGSGRIQLYKNVAGVQTSIGTYNLGSAWSGTKTFRLEFVGTSITVLVDGTALVTVTDSGVTASGKTSVSLNSATGNNSTAFQIDNLQIYSHA